MFRAIVKRQFNLPRIRLLHSTSVSKNKSISDSQVPKPSAPKGTYESVMGAPMHAPNKFEKFLLVWIKRYPSLDQVPQKVSYECIKLAHTKARIQVSFVMVFLTVIGFIVTATLGKKEAAGGRHIISDRMNWIQEVRKKKAAEAEINAAEKS
ncbi:protein FAM162A [Ptiloglossa arizonensis]|uniref:protein FAM162A n=1 Tax=Ptiloglossa arizonensis TaxID=3350558 RepID=UPI003FA19356